jgi:hypothetical protein
MAETTIITIQITTDRSGTGTLAKETIKKRNELINRLLSGEIMDISYEEQTNTAYIAVKETQIENNVYKEKQANVPYAQIMELYNTICQSYPKIMTIDGQRRKAVSARWTKYKKTDTFRALFEKAEASKFLKGENARNWKATFDWLIGANNMAKTLEGNYDNENARRGKPAQKQKENRALKYQQRQYKDEELSGIILDFDE